MIKQKEMTIQQTIAQHIKEAMLAKDKDRLSILRVVVGEFNRVGKDVSDDEARKSSLEIATSLQIDHLLSRPCHELSFGEQRRAALAGLLVLRPSLLLLDEPTSGLDPVAAYNLLRLVEQTIQGTETTCIWATHNLHSIPPKAKRTILLKKGHIIFDGDSTEGLSRPWLIKAGLAIPQSENETC